MARNVIFGEEKKIWQSVDVLDQAVVQAMAEVVRVAHSRVVRVAGWHGGRRRRYRPGGGGRVAAGAGAVDMEGEGMRPPEPEPEVSENGEPVPLEPGEGVLELHPNGYGFLRSPDNNYSRERTDPFVPATMIDRFRLREGNTITAKVQQGRRQQGPRVREIEEIEGMSPEKYAEYKNVRSAHARSIQSHGCGLKQASSR